MFFSFSKLIFFFKVIDQSSIIYLNSYSQPLKTHLLFLSFQGKISDGCSSLWHTVCCTAFGHCRDHPIDNPPWILNTLSHKILTITHIATKCIHIFTPTPTHTLQNSLFTSQRGVCSIKGVIKPLMATTHVSAQLLVTRHVCVHTQKHTETHRVITWIIYFGN